jgi:hypothetical protein
VSDRHEPIKLTVDEFNELLEYSASYPTGTTIGKCWKAHLGTGEWVHQEYAEHPTDDSKVLIVAREIIIVGKDGKRMGIKPAIIIEKMLPDADAVEFMATLTSGGGYVVLKPMTATDSDGRMSIKELEFGKAELEALLELFE